MESMNAGLRWEDSTSGSSLIFVADMEKIKIEKRT